MIKDLLNVTFVFLGPGSEGHPPSRVNFIRPMLAMADQSLH